jgi:hypothetical protein
MQLASGAVTIGVISATKQNGTHFYDWQVSALGFTCGIMKLWVASDLLRSGRC